MKKLLIPSMAETATPPKLTSTSPPMKPNDGLPDTIMTNEYVKLITKYSYLWAWPMINIHNRYKLFAQLKEHGRYQA